MALIMEGGEETQELLVGRSSFMAQNSFIWKLMTIR